MVLTTAGPASMNRQVDVARTYLQDKGLLK